MTVPLFCKLPLLSVVIETKEMIFLRRLLIRFNKAQPLVSNKLWEDLILGVIGEQFTYPDEICGIVISIRNNQDTMSIWNKSGRD